MLSLLDEEQLLGSGARAPPPQVRGIRKHFNTKKGLFVAVDGVTIDVEPNTLVALLGPSGSGAFPEG